MSDENFTCAGCGAPADPNAPRPSMCQRCPPETCGNCGGVNHIATDRQCACWVSLEGVPTADVKALFAKDGTFSIDPTVGGSR
jgi:hypothetical protein